MGMGADWCRQYVRLGYQHLPRGLYTQVNKSINVPCGVEAQHTGRLSALAQGAWRAATWLLVAGLALVVFANGYIYWATTPYLYDQDIVLPPRRVGLVLGTSERLAGGKPNRYFAYRIAAAARLYKAHKVRILLLSGDARSPFYNEPRQMRLALMQAGVPAHAIWVDEGGVRTVDSIMRCHQIYGQVRFVVISQSWHNERAIYLAQAAGLDAIGYNATDVEGWPGLQTHLRELAAKVLAMWDMAGMKYYN